MIGLLRILWGFRKSLVELEELYAAFHKQTYGKDNHDESENLQGAGKTDKRGCLPVKLFCKPPLCFYNLKKLAHLLPKSVRLFCRIFSKSNIKRGSGEMKKTAVRIMGIRWINA